MRLLGVSMMEAVAPASSGPGADPSGDVSLRGGPFGGGKETGAHHQTGPRANQPFSARLRSVQTNSFEAAETGQQSGSLPARRTKRIIIRHAALSRHPISLGGSKRYR